VFLVLLVGLHVTLQRAGGGEASLADGALEGLAGAVGLQVDQSDKISRDLTPSLQPALFLLCLLPFTLTW
ncbi:hypothetical protein PS008_25170, partial [Shigella sonnei]|nr:hypothetical protein [Shigella sonnei]